MDDPAFWQPLLAKARDAVRKLFQEYQPPEDDDGAVGVGVRVGGGPRPGSAAASARASESR